MKPNILSVILQAIEEKKGTQVVCLNLKGESDLCDFQVICTAENDRQSRAIAEAIQTKCLELLKIKPAYIEGKSGGLWILMDFGSYLIHIFQKEYRDYYALESIWPNAQFDPKKQN
jgi:ribosome-associated protein